MTVELYNDGRHKCLAFPDLVAGGEGVQSNQFLIVDGDHEALIDPGGDLTFTALSTAVTREVGLEGLDYILASHQDPDIIASVPSWITRTPAKIVSSVLWSRFLPHLVPMYMGDRISERCICVPDQGMDLPFGSTVIKCLPAHFLHSVGNLQFYDPVSRILFSGDMGANLVPDGPEQPVTTAQEFEALVPYMKGFHQRYMGSNKICRLWVNMVRRLEIDMLVPQHGRPFRGPEAVNRFLEWIEKLPCGMDLMTQENYKIPG